MGRSDWWKELLGGNTLVMFLILGIALFLLYRDDLIDIKSAKSWKTMKPLSKLMLINGCIFILYLLYREYKSFETFNCRKDKN